MGGLSFLPPSIFVKVPTNLPPILICDIQSLSKCRPSVDLSSTNRNPTHLLLQLHSAHQNDNQGLWYSGVGYWTKSNAIGREGKLRLRSNISPSFAPPSPSKLHPWPISLSQRSNHMQYHSLNFHSKPPPLCRLLQNRTHVKIVKLTIRCQSLKFVKRQ